MEDKSSFTSQAEPKRPRRYSPCLASGLSLSRALPVETTWTASDIVKAGCILKIPPRPLHFEDEGEMRRIYSLIYDVFRCNLSQLFDVNCDYIYVAKSSVKIWELLIYIEAAERNLMITRLTSHSFPTLCYITLRPFCFQWTGANVFHLRRLSHGCHRSYWSELKARKDGEQYSTLEGLV